MWAKSYPVIVLLILLASSSTIPLRVVVHAQSPPLLPIPQVIILLGDSYASGNGAGNYIGGNVGECYRSTTTWGAQFAQSIRSTSTGTSTFINRGCSGGRFADILNDRPLGVIAKDGNGTCPVPPSGSDEYYTNNVGSSTCNRLLKSQIQTLNSTVVDLVLLAMGGNDMQFENLVKKCLIFGLRDASDCQDQINFVRNYAATWTQQLSNVLVAMAPLLKPTARVIVLQFPHIVQNTPFSFSELFGGGSIEITNNLRSLGSVLDDSQRTAVTMANNAVNRTFVLYYDQVKTVFEGHEPHPSAFTDNPNAWVYEGSAPITAEIYHLNPIGHAQLAIALYNYIVPLVPPIPAPVASPVAPTTPVSPVASSPMGTTPTVVVAPVPTPIRLAPVPPPVILDPPTTTAPITAPTRRRGGFLSTLFRFLFGWLF